MQHIFMRMAVYFTLSFAVLTAGQIQAQVADHLVVSWAMESFTPGSGGCRWSLPEIGGTAMKRNTYYIAPPANGEQWQEWLQALRAYRGQVREHLHDIESFNCR